MDILVMEVGDIGANCYIVSQGQRAVVIDPGADGEAILDALNKRGLSLAGIINTHGHFDHIGANGTLKAATDAPLYIHRLDEPLLADAYGNLSLWGGTGQILSPPADGLLEGGEELKLAGLSIKVLHTPGHTPGCICLQVDTALFTGDTLFAGSVGRVDFPNSSKADLMRSLQKVIMALPLDLVIYPGHGPSSTLRQEKENNPFLMI
ncbi:MAG: MBL fold metallo-hydrolase [Firmicutes bacterium]|nr:MBL fold metallo-hydrolase [Bacillota bacterium]